MATTNLWQSLLRDSSVRTPIPTTQILLLGGNEVGKTSLLQRWQGVKNPNERLQGAAILPSDFTSFYLPSEEDPTCQFNIWSLNTDSIASELPLLSLSIDVQKLKETIALIMIDASKPWTAKATLEKWLSTLYTIMQEKLATLPDNQRADIIDSNQRHWLSYIEPGQAAPSTSAPYIKDDDTSKSLPDGILIHNVGIPIVIVISKADIMPDDTVKVDFVQYTVRQVALAYGAAVCYTSSKAGTNCELLKDYVMHRSHPDTFKFTQPPKLVDRGAIFVPSGYDTLELIEQSLVGSQPRWQKSTVFEKFIPTPQEKNDDSALLHPEIRVDSNQLWLSKLEKAAGSGLADLQKTSVEASRRAEELATARRMEAESRKEKVEIKKDTKDVNPKHLANFFNNLLSRPDKQKATRASGLGSTLHDKTKSSKDMKELAEEELKKM